MALDTNVVVRLLTGDDPEQLRRVVALLERAEASGVECLLTNIVLSELEWVLESAYDATRADVSAAITALLGRGLFVFEDRKVVAEALASHAAGKADLSDYLLGAVARKRGVRTTWTFGRAAAKATDFSLL